MENIRVKDKDNWNLNSSQFLNLASSLKNFFTHSGLMQKVNCKNLKTTNDILSKLIVFVNNKLNSNLEQNSKTINLNYIQ